MSHHVSYEYERKSGAWLIITQNDIGIACAGTGRNPYLGFERWTSDWRCRCPRPRPPENEQVPFDEEKRECRKGLKKKERGRGEGRKGLREGHDRRKEAGWSATSDKVGDECSLHQAGKALQSWWKNII